MRYRSLVIPAGAIEQRAACRVGVLQVLRKIKYAVVGRGSSALKAASNLDVTKCKWLYDIWAHALTRLVPARPAIWLAAYCCNVVSLHIVHQQRACSCMQSLIERLRPHLGSSKVGC